MQSYLSNSRTAAKTLAFEFHGSGKVQGVNALIIRVFVDVVFPLLE